MTPCMRIDSASPDPASPSKRLRGCRGFGWIASTGELDQLRRARFEPADEHLEAAAETPSVRLRSTSSIATFQ